MSGSNNSDVMICKMIDEQGNPISFKDLECTLNSCFKTEFKNNIPYFKYAGEAQNLENSKYDFVLRDLLMASSDNDSNMIHGGTMGGFHNPSQTSDNYGIIHDLPAKRNSGKYICLYTLSLTDLVYLSTFKPEIMSAGFLLDKSDGYGSQDNMCEYAYRATYEKAIDSMQKAINDKIVGDSDINQKIKKYNTDCNMYQYEIDGYKLKLTDTWNLKDSEKTINIRRIWDDIINILKPLNTLANAENKNESDENDDRIRENIDISVRTYSLNRNLYGYLFWMGDIVSTYDEDVKDENGNLKLVNYSFSDSKIYENADPLPPKYKKIFNTELVLISLFDCPGESNSFIDWIYCFIRETSGDNVKIESEQGNRDYDEYYNSIKEEKGINIVKIVAALIGDIEQKLSTEYGIDAVTFFNLYEVFNKLSTKITSYDPYITSVTHHWYKDVYFKDDDKNIDVYSYVDDTQSVTKKFIPEGNASNDIINELTDDNHYFNYTMTNIGNFIKQTAQPKIVKTESWHYMVKNWIKYGYYFIYDGTQETAERIDYAREILKDKYEISNPLLIDISSQEDLYNGVNVSQIDKKAKELNEILSQYDTKYTYDTTSKEIVNKGLKGLRLQRIDFEKKSSLTAFSILEGMHTKDSEYIYRDLKEFLIELGYFTRADFEEIETDVFEWIIPKYEVYKDEWPDPKYERNNTQYGSYIRNSKLLSDERKKEAEEEARKLAEKGGITDNTDNSNIMGTTEDRSDIAFGYRTTTKVGTITYKNYKQGSVHFANKYYQGQAWSGQACGPTATAILLSGYGSRAMSPEEVGKWLEDNTDAGSRTDGTSNVEIATLLREKGLSCENYDLDAVSNRDETIEEAINAIKDGIPVLTTGSYTQGRTLDLYIRSR